MKKLFKSLFLPLLLGIIVSIAAAGCGNQNDELLESVRKRFGRDAMLHGVTVEKIENGRVYYTAKYGNIRGFYNCLTDSLLWCKRVYSENSISITVADNGKISSE